MKKQIDFRIVSLVFSVLVICFAIAFYVVAWEEPSSAPPGGNVFAPLNVSNDPQIKSGSLRLGGLTVDNDTYLATSAGYVGIGTTSPTGPLTVVSSKGNFVIVETELIPDEGSVALETLLPGDHGMLDIIEDSGRVAGTVYIQGGVNSVTKVANPLNLISTAGADGCVSVLADGDNTYTLKNRRGATHYYTLMYRGF